MNGAINLWDMNLEKDAMDRESFLEVLKSLLCPRLTEVREVQRKHKKQSMSQNSSASWERNTMLWCLPDLSGSDSGLVHTSSLTHHDPLTFCLQIPLR